VDVIIPTAPVLADPADFDEPTHPADGVLRGVLADWGIWPDDYYPSTYSGATTLAQQFANQIGVDEAVEHYEVFGLARDVAHYAYANGAGATVPVDVPDIDPEEFNTPTAPADIILRTLAAEHGIWRYDLPTLDGQTLGEAFAEHLGDGEAIEHTAMFGFFRELAHAAYATAKEQVNVVS